MQYRSYGKLGFEVSALGMGCMRLPRTKDADGNIIIDKEKAIELIRYAVDHGVNYFDSAFTYHNSNSETLLGEALDGGYRQKVKIATKQPIRAIKETADIRRNLETTLKKLRTDCIDVYLMHNIQGNTWDEFQRYQFIEEYEKFRSEGLIKHIGFSYHGNYADFERIVKAYPWAMCQMQQNFLDADREATTKGLRLAGELGIALVIMEPLRGGGLANTPPGVKKIYDDYPLQHSAAEWAFRYLLDYPEVSCILSGMTTLEQLKENIETFSKPDTKPGCLTDADKAMLKQVKEAYESIVTIPCTACEYCIPCPQGVNIPRVFKNYNEGMMFGSFNQPQRSYMFARNAKEDASYCVECGACESKCPQSIKIVEQLKLSHAALDGWYE